jgi:hypothetical protein
MRALQNILSLSKGRKYYLKDWLNLIFKKEGLVDVPVAHEPNRGAYVLSAMPCQTTYNSGTGKIANEITRDLVPEIKLMWQLTL